MIRTNKVLVKEQKGTVVMNDLISRNDLLHKFIMNKSGKHIPEVDCDNFDVTIRLKDVKNAIQTSPTAYNVEKVIKEIDRELKPDAERFENEDDFKLELERHNKYINIIRHGGVNTCEWERNSLGSWHTECHRLISDCNPKGYEYCPYCGKSIRIIS